MFTRRHLIKAAGAGLALTGPGFKLRSARAAGAAIDLPAALPDGLRNNAMLDSLPGKKPLIKLSYRPPNYETPIEYFRTAVTPNDAFFVRYHLSNIPEVDVKTWKIVVGGEGANGQAEFSLDDLKRLPPAELVAVNLCSGNRRGLFQPHVPGVQWSNGAMGCARWKGARLKDLLDKVGLKKEAIEIAFDGADSGVTDKTPDFIKSIPTWKAIEDTTLVAYEMNGVPLPHLHGFPARLIVPGWTGTYWMKHLTSIKPVTKPESGFWMTPAYRIPLGKFPLVARFTSQETAVNTPITEIVVNSLITNPADGAGRHRRHRLGRRLRHQHGRGVERRRQDLGHRDVGRGSRPLRLPHLQLRFCAQGPRQTNRDGARLEQDRPKPDDRADPQPGRVSPQRGSQRHVQRGLREVAMRALIIALAAAAIALPAAAEEKPVELKKAPGLDKVEGNCSGCHSLDYIVMNSPFPNAALWDAEVTKMIKAFGAPISEADAKVIADYLNQNYGS